MKPIQHKNSHSWNYILLVILSCIGLVIGLDSLWLKHNQNQRPDPAESIRDLTISYILAQGNLDTENLQATLNKLDKTISVQTIETGVNQNANLQTRAFKDVIIAEQRYLLIDHPLVEYQYLIGPLEDKPNGSPDWIAMTVFYGAISLFLVAWLLPILRGLKKLSAAAAAFAANPKRPFDAISTPYPVDGLATSFNQMANKITELFSTQQDLTHGLSHELRTPLARSKFALASLEKSHTEPALVESIKLDVAEMERIVEGILTFARLDDVKSVINVCRINPQDMIDGCLASQISPHHIRISTTTDEKQCMGDEALLSLALSNVLANALRYASQQIIVNFHINEWHYQLTVEDDGIGIPSEQRGDVLKAFKKGPDSSGFGFGLAFTAKIMALHKGKLTIEDSAIGGCKVILLWPNSYP